MSKVAIIIRHEFRQKVRSKAFIIMTLLAPVLLAAITAIPVLIASFGGGSKHLVVVDQTGKLGSYFIQDSSEHKNDSSRVSMKIISTTQATSGLIDSLKWQLNAKEIQGYLVIPPTAISDTAAVATLRLSNTNDFSTENRLSQSYREGLFAERMRSSGIDPNFIKRSEESYKVETLKVSEGKEASDNGVGFAAGYITGFFLYISIILYGSIIMQSVIEEKSSRVIELLASSARPIDILMGKVIGVGCAGLIQMSVWALMFAGVSWFALPAILATMGGSVTSLITPLQFIYFVVYFVLGYLIYSTLYAGAGATVEQASDAQQVVMPITLLNVVSFISLTAVIQNPSSTSSVILSLIPFFSPVLMMGRIFSETPPFWQIALSFVIMIGTFFGVLWISARIYRTGILMYGKKYSLKEIIKWVKFS